MVYYIWYWLRCHIYKIYKYTLHLYDGKCEIARICCGQTVGSDPSISTVMLGTFSASLAASTKLFLSRDIIFTRFESTFSVQAAREYIERIKGFDQMRITGPSKLILMRNMNQCLEHLRQVNLFINSVQLLAKTKYNPVNPVHIALLKSLWTNLMPQQRMPHVMGSGTVLDPAIGNSSNDWGLIGFQGNDPGTDFRGMGLLGLMQLEFFTSSYHTPNSVTSASASVSTSTSTSTEVERVITRAQIVLKAANHDRRYFPFAATGINISNLCVELLRETRLHLMLFDGIAYASSEYCADSGDDGSKCHSNADLTEKVSLLHKTSLSSEYGTMSSCSSSITGVGANTNDANDPNDAKGNNDAPLAHFYERFHTLYGDVYTEWTEYWVAKDPENIMSFPVLFKEFKAILRERYRVI